MKSLAVARNVLRRIVHDVRTLAYGEARMDEGGTYPMYIALEARTPTRYSILLALVAAGCARGDEVRT